MNVDRAKADFFVSEIAKMAIDSRKPTVIDVSSAGLTLRAAYALHQHYRAQGFHVRIRLRVKEKTLTLAPPKGDRK